MNPVTEKRAPVIETGGPAFPTLKDQGASDAGFPIVETEHPGMTMRDYFAAAALQGILGGYYSKACSGANMCAAWAYECADAMLATRDGKA